MLSRFHLTDISTIAHHLGTLMLITGLTMAIPLVVALAFGEIAHAAVFFFGLGLCMLVGAALRMLKSYGADRRCTLVITGLGWVVVGLASALPLYLSGSYSSYVNALFDAVSALTTTGASLSSDLDSMSNSVTVWHSVLTIAGGQAVIFIAVYLGFFGETSFVRVGATKGFSDLVGKMRRFGSTRIWIIVGSLLALGTAALAGILIYIGVAPAQAVVEAFNLAANAASTGGFVSHTSSLVYYHSWLVDAVVLLLTFMAAINVGIYLLAFKGKRSDICRNSEFRTLLGWSAVFVACITIGLTRDGVYATLSGMLDRGAFMALAAVTTSGMQTIYPEQLATCFSDGVVILLMLAIFLGASSCSAAGGVKLLRLVTMLRWFGYTVFRAILPDSVHLSIRYNYFGPRRCSPTEATQAMTIVVLYIAAAALGAMFFIAHGNDALTSILESIAYVANDGLTANIVTTTSSIDMKIVAILQMWAGRLEFVVLLAAVSGLVISLRLPRKGAKSRRGEDDSPWHKLKRDRESKAAGKFEQVAAFERVSFANTAPLPTVHADDAEDEAAESCADPFAPKAPEPECPHDGGYAHPALLACALVLALAFALPQAAALAASIGEDAGESQPSASDVSELRSSSESSYHKTKIAALLSATDRMDGRRVKVTGKVYGSIIKSSTPSYVWVNIKSSGSMIGVCMPESEAAKIENCGDYWHIGTEITVCGTFNLVCSEHTGELDLHADSVKVVADGSTRSHRIPQKLPTAGIAMLAVALVLMALRRLVLVRRRPRKHHHIR